jgi:hypothetical protein
MRAANPERDESETQTYWRKHLAEHPEVLREEAQPGRAPVGRTIESSRPPSWAISESQAVGLASASNVVGCAGGALVGYGLGPGHSPVVVAIGSLLIVAWLPVRIAADRWRREALRGRRQG